MVYICRGIINLCIAYFDKEDFCGIMLINGVRIYYFKVSLEVERQYWIIILELVKVKVVYLMSSYLGSERSV